MRLFLIALLLTTPAFAADYYVPPPKNLPQDPREAHEAIRKRHMHLNRIRENCTGCDCIDRHRYTSPKHAAVGEAIDLMKIPLEHSLGLPPEECEH